MPVHEHENKICPRCQAAFQCKPGDIVHCQCYTAQLNDAARILLAQEFTDCLCINCLKAISTETQA